MTDEFIRRTDAVEKAMEYCPDDDGSCPKAATDLRELLDDLENLPAADVKPVVRGKWIDDGSGCVVCSECGEEHEWGMFRANFCDNCGAEMREE